jgi:hypothetical protein
MKKIILLIFLFICFIAKTQNTYYKVYNPTLGGSSKAIKTLSGGLAVAVLDSTLSVYKTDLNGNIIWKKQFHHSPKFNLPVRLTQDLVDSSYYISTGYGGNPNTNLMKVDNSGNLIWSKTLLLNVVYIRASMGGGFILSANAGYDSYVLRFDKAGIIVWQNRYQRSPPNGSSFFPYIFQCKNGDYLFSGSCLNNAFDPLMFRIDSSGVLKWFNIYDLGTDNDFVSLSTESSDQSILVCGNTNNSAYYQDFYLRIDSLGNVLNFKKYHNIHNPAYEVILSVAPNRFLIAGNAFYSGPKSTEYLYTYMDHTGTVLWNKTSGHPASGLGYEAIQYGVTVSPNSFVLGGGDIEFIAMIDSLGNGFCNADTIILKDTTYFIPVLTPTIPTGAVNYSTINNTPSVTTPPVVLTTYCNITLGLNSEPGKAEEPSAFPNPVSSNSFFEFKSEIIEENSEIIVTDVFGRKIYASKLNQENNKISTLNWESGIYFFTIIKDDKSASSGKICVID